MSDHDPSLVADAASAWTVALDLEGVLISSAVSLFPRPGLHDFFLGLSDIGVRIALYTSVGEARVQPILHLLAAEGSVPGWAAALPCVPWDGPYKDLHRVARAIPGAVLSRTLLVDDTPAVVQPGQESQWVRTRPYEPPFTTDDGELRRVLGVIRTRCGAPADAPAPSVDSTPPDRSAPAGR